MKVPGRFLSLLTLVALSGTAFALGAAWRTLRSASTPASGACGPHRHQQLAQARRRGCGAFEHANDAILITDHAQIIVQANRAAASLFGTTVGQMEGAALARYIPRDPRHATDQATAQYFGNTGIRLRMKGRRTGDYAVTGIRADGQRLPLEGSLAAMYENGKPLFTIILRDVSVRKQVMARLEQSYEQLRELSAALQTIREEERKHIARELHDDLGQLLATLRADLVILQRHPHDSHEQKIIDGIDALLQAAIASLRRIAGNLRPQVLDEGGLYFALDSLRREFVARHGIACRLHAQENELVLNDAYSTAIYRMVQEALTNITRHADASKVELSLRRLQGWIDIVIQDDGRGIAEHDLDKTASYGLIGMRERVRALRGEMSIASDGGTQIMIRLPLPPSVSAA